MRPKIKPFLEPFKQLAGQPMEFLESIIANQRIEKEAIKRSKAIVKAYRDLLQNPQYKPIYREAFTTMGLNLSALVNHAMECQHCVRYAAPVKSLQDIVLDPIEQVWKEDMRMKAMEGEAEVNTEEYTE